MDSVEAGNLVIAAQRDKLVFEIRGQGSTVVPLEDLPEIVAFLTACNAAGRNRRTGLRLCLDDIDPGALADLTAQVESAEGQWLPVRLVDLSIAGVHIDSPGFAGDYGDQVKVRLGWRGNEVELPAVLVRRAQAGGTTAIRFTDVFDADGDLDPPPALRYLVEELELLWLAQRLSSAARPS